MQDATLATEFIAFCLQRRPAAWPDIYDEMCWVASRRLFQGLGYAELSRQGLSLNLTQLPYLRRLVEQTAQALEA
ncbi:MAG: hypothetical protein JXA37_09980 [Chloroflexia bacterium]|nr:hypothetical protein [Chloroflexia bacterium]